MNSLVRSITILIASLVTVTIGHAQTVSPVPAPTIITTAPYTISRAGYYQLGADLIYAGNGLANDAIITINASNVTLDFGGHYISGPSGTPATNLTGVLASERGNLVIQHGTIAYCEYGITLNGNGKPGSLNINQTIQNMLVTYCYVAGIQLDNASNSVVLNNRISFIGGSTNYGVAYGLFDFNGTGNEADGNLIFYVTSAQTYGAAYGINGDTTLTASNNKVSNVTNTASGSANLAFGISATAFTINNVISASYQGVYNGGKYTGNLTSGCTIPFSGGTAVGTNN